MKTIAAWLVLLIVSRGAAAANDCKDIGTGRLARTPASERLIVKPERDAEFQQMVQRRAGPWANMRVNPVGSTGYYVLDSEVADTFGSVFKESGKFKSIQKDVAVIGMTTTPPEQEFRDGNLWGLTAIHAEDAWDFGTGSATVVAAVIDSGIDRAHPDLTRNTWNIAAPFTVTGARAIANCLQNDFGFDAISGNCQPKERAHHGTRVSGVIGADGRNNGQFVVGVNWSVTLLPVVLLDENEIGCASRAAEALEFVHLVKAKGIAPVRVVNLSWGLLERSEAIKEQLDALAKDDVVIVAAAGNEGCPGGLRPLYPAAFKSVPTLISVGATNRAGNRAAVSNCDNTMIDIGAPGEDIKTTEKLRRVESATGTSIAAAFVTGAVALLASQCPELNAIELKKLILDTAERKPSLASDFIEGRFLDLLAAARACHALHSPNPTPSP